MIEMLLVVQVGGRRAAILADRVNSVIETTELTPVPHAPAHIAGLAALRSRPLTVIDCNASLELADRPEGASARRAVVVEHEGHLYGLLVDGADDIVAASAAPTPLGADPGPGWSRVAIGRVESEHGALLVIDIGALIDGPPERMAA